MFVLTIRLPRTRKRVSPEFALTARWPSQVSSPMSEDCQCAPTSSPLGVQAAAPTGFSLGLVDHRDDSGSLTGSLREPMVTRAPNIDTSTSTVNGDAGLSSSGETTASGTP